MLPAQRSEAAKFTLKYYEYDNSRLNNPKRLREVTAYDRCKANRRCNWGVLGESLHFLLHFVSNVAFLLQSMTKPLTMPVSTTSCLTTVNCTRQTCFWTLKTGAWVFEASTGRAVHLPWTPLLSNKSEVLTSGHLTRPRWVQTFPATGLSAIRA